MFLNMDWVITSQYPAHLIDTPAASSLCTLCITVSVLIVLNIQTDPLFCSLLSPLLSPHLL